MTAILGAVGAYASTASSGGGGSGSINIADRYVTKISHGGTATATYTIDNDGTVRNHNLTLLETWLPTGSAADYEVRATLSSGDTPSSGTIGSWLNCGTDRSWTNSNSAHDESTITSVLFVEIRDAAAPNTVRDNATITINAYSGA